ncbi:S1 family peptidase [Saccharothrix sp. NRRL B-16348]|uniref:S1 family peptidase n=1 Tax=Saccharothrix sp. NRRL B-16348 TaxID=1415542 RepID=UPI0009E7AB19|nr:S1 family peptidase [Saccharothrix sp. NRRL B-16348]
MTFAAVARRAGVAVLAAGLAFATAGPVSGEPVGPAVAKERLDRGAAARPGTVTGWFVDEAAQTVVVSVHGAATGVAEWARGLGAGAVTVEHVAEAPRPVWDLVGGQPIHSGGTRCTLGFNARSGATRYILSAGHCVGAGSEWHGVGGYIGPSAGSSFPGNDYGLIRVVSTAAVSTPLVDRHSSGPDVTISGFTTPPVGSSLCYSSPAAGWRCGSVTGINQTVCYPQGCVNQLIRATACPEPGASGAPAVTNPGSGTAVRAVGLVSGGSGNCSTGGTTWVQPIAEPLSAYGLTLFTG